MPQAATLNRASAGTQLVSRRRMLKGDCAGRNDSKRGKTVDLNARTAKGGSVKPGRQEIVCKKRGKEGHQIELVW